MNASNRAAAVVVLAVFTVSVYLLLQMLFSPELVPQSSSTPQPTTVVVAPTAVQDSSVQSNDAVDVDPPGGEDFGFEGSTDPFIEGDTQSTDPDISEVEISTPQIPTAPAVAAILQGIPLTGIPTATVEQGLQPLEYTMDGSVKVFNLTAAPVAWTILEGVAVTAYAYNGMVPGPLIRVTEGDNVRVNVTNALPEDTTIHWQARDSSIAQQGIPELTQSPIAPGETFTYEFTASTAGSYSYYSLTNQVAQSALGLFGAYIVDSAEAEDTPPNIDMPIMFSEWRVTGGLTFPAASVGGAEPNYYTINGKSYPDTTPINVRVGERVRLRLYSMSSFTHPVHLHGGNFIVVGMDGAPLPANRRYTTDTVVLNPGQQIDIEFVPTQIGTWLFKCNVGLHTINNFGLEEGGLILPIEVSASE